MAVINTVLNNRTDLHIERLHEAVNWASVAATERLAQLTQKFGGGADGQLKALKEMSSLAHRQAVVMSFADVFWVLTVLFVALAVLGIVMKKPAALAPGAAGH